jgi:1-deoxy-D-xylulose-5-phosphate synthase
VVLSAILEFAAQHQYATTVRILGIPDEFIEHGTVAELQHYCGIDVKSLSNSFSSFKIIILLFKISYSK